MTIEIRIRQDEGNDAALPMAWDSVWITNPNGSAGGHADWAIADPEVEENNVGGFQALRPVETAIIICLFTDRRRPDWLKGDDDSAERRGWHGDTYDIETEEGEGPLGSLLWTLERAALTQDTQDKARAYAEEALETLILQGVVASFEIETEVDQINNRLSLGVKAYGPDGEQTYASTFILE